MGTVMLNLSLLAQRISSNLVLSSKCIKPLNNRIIIAGLATSDKTPKTVSVPPPPKKPLSSFLLFCAKQRPELKKQDPGLNVLQATNKIADAWRGLPEAEKGVYSQESAKSFLEYAAQRDQWWKHLSEEQKTSYLEMKKQRKQQILKREKRKALKALGKPKRPLTAYVFFVANFPKADHAKEFMKKASLAWQATSDEEKKPYIEMAEADAQRYKKELEKWEVSNLMKKKV